MIDTGNLMHVTHLSAHHLSAMVNQVEEQLPHQARPSLGRKLADAAFSLLALVVDARMLSLEGYEGKLRALGALKEARTAAGQVKTLLKTTMTRGHLTEAAVKPIVGKVDEVLALLMALTVRLRGSTNALIA